MCSSLPEPVTSRGCKEVLSENLVTAKLCYVMGLVSKEDFLEGDGRYLTEEEHLEKTEN